MERNTDNVDLQHCKMLKVSVLLSSSSYGGPGFSSVVCSKLLSRFKKQIEVTDLSEKISDVASVLKKSVVLLSEPGLIYEKLEHLNNVKWAHSTWAGVNQLTELPTPPKFILTRHAGSFGQLMAEYVIAQMVNRERDYFKVHRDQLDSKWCPNLTPPRMLNELSIGILGVGEIGLKIAEICKAFGMTVWALSRSSLNKSTHIDHHRQQEGLSELLSNSDYVCNVLPSTSNTKGLLNGDKLSPCANKKSVLINIGRGDVISDDTVVTAIQKGWLSGAILDVFEEEPLPEDSELWRMPEVTITPHIAGITPKDEAIEVFMTNLELFLEGKEMKYVVDWTKGY